ncbi:bifunctional 4-hydroxy-2-oxoglutarate aldolase/2-dehydro-3-deoxy-phosphogluconate aldolase [Dyadobacter crusticola]|uniref:bifunctional 4-hydroxy-2-oxoglutarate aldolase/2-dehydro-3-deoxy-phosphogluconate aldolase n=1 Tax=Dyadobacter crusticola TaxID=292407 RepID=UPI0004E131F0|nr:bifunctional 4-hydroxy-2-oxoglutarate aldolase/2-dehydro-3-deoxy-phosphogluconate aldolase [Dyadobacter crusticola]
MNKEKFSIALFEKAPLVGIIRNVAFDDIKRILPIYREAGLTTVEITMNTPGAAEMIRYAVENEAEGLNIGAGTVCTKDDLKSALEAGAQFIVTPVISKKVIKTCVKKEIPVFPGAFTPTEIYNAWSLGATMVKIYPATSLGPEYIKDLKAPMNQLKLLPTGGVGLENMTAFMKAGANGLGIGGQLFDKKLIQDKDWQGLKSHFERFVQKLTGN